MQQEGSPGVAWLAWLLFALFAVHPKYFPKGVDNAAK